MMIEPNIIETDLDFISLYTRPFTDAIVIHHTGNPQDDDCSAEEIHESHKSMGWSGIGYHYVIRKDGTIEQGRPEWATGSHAYGHNSLTLGVHVCGNFCIAKPTNEQIESLAYLIGYLCEKYDLPCDDRHVVGHCDLMPTACPGDNLYDMLQTIRGKGVWYQQNYQGGD